MTDNAMENGSLIQYQPHQCIRLRRSAIAIVFITTTLVWISVVLNRTQLLIEQQQHHQSRTPHNLGRTSRYHRRRILAKTEEWEDDDDDDEEFHLQDDDATRKHLNEDTDDITTATSVNTTTTKSQTTTDSANTKKGTKKQQQQNNIEDEGNIIFSESVGSKEKVIPPPPPPPSSMQEEKSNIRGAENQTKTDQERTNELYKIDPNYTPTKELNQTRLPSSSSTGGSIQHDNNNINDSSQPEEEADTIFDDLLRGFSFASLFCLSLFVLYKLCNYCCVKCGLFPDERVVEARLRRMRLKRKRSYRLHHNNNQEEQPPLDTRLWGEWMAKRGNIIERADDDGDFYSSGGVWDAVDENSSVWEDDIQHSPSDDAGFIEFDSSNNDVNGNGMVEMAVWDTTNNGITDASSSPELEYGEGEELEDASHDGRLFDDEDGGKGVEQEADKFFKGKEVGKKKPGEIAQERRKKKKNAEKIGAKDVAANGTVSVSNNNRQLNKQTPQDVEQDKEVSDDSFFDALQSSPDDKPSDNDNNPSLAVKEHGNDADLLGFDHGNTTEVVAGELDNGNQRRKNNHRRNQSSSSGGFTSSIVVEDKGYDEESDLLGLRSESPPPLDLEEMSRIEQKLNEDMKNAKLY